MPSDKFSLCHFFNIILNFWFFDLPLGMYSEYRLTLSNCHFAVVFLLDFQERRQRTILTAERCQLILFSVEATLLISDFVAIRYYRQGQSAALLRKIKEHHSETVCKNDIATL